MSLIQKSWPVFIYAITISAESILIEFLTTSLRLSPLLLSAASITFGGFMLLLAKVFLGKRDERIPLRKSVVIFSQSTRNLMFASLALGIGFFIAVMSSANSIHTLQKSTMAIFSYGDIEAIVSAIGFAVAVLFLTKLV